MSKFRSIYTTLNRKKAIFPILAILFFLTLSPSPTQADVLVGTEGNLNFALGQPGLLYGWGGLVEFGFVPGKGGIKISGAIIGGDLGLEGAKEADTTYRAYYLSAIMKYNTPTRLPWREKWAMRTSYYLYSLNPWIGLGPGFQLNQAIISDKSRNFSPSSDFLMEIGFGFNISLGMFGVSSRELRNLFVIWDMRFAYNLSSIERYNNQGQNLDSSKALFSTFENYFIWRLGVAYKL